MGLEDGLLLPDAADDRPARVRRRHLPASPHPLLPSSHPSIPSRASHPSHPSSHPTPTFRPASLTVSVQPCPSHRIPSHFASHPPALPSSLESERGIFASCFDQSGSRLITGEADKTIKIWKEDTDATEESHPINWEPPRDRKRY